MNKHINDYNKRFKDNSPQDLLTYFLNEHKGKIKLASSLGAEDQVLTDMVLNIDPKASIFVLDTGRLNQETYDVMADTMAHYSMHYQVYYPEQKAVEKLLHQKGPNSFYESVENRKECCSIRKVVPLSIALGNCAAWITGLRREQAITRQSLDPVEWDEAHQCIKLNPLFNWTTAQVWHYIKQNKVPYNKLHDQGYPSIGCAPCTRALGKDDDNRAGRWWWENPETKECGLHLKDGKLVRKTP